MLVKDVIDFLNSYAPLDYAEDFDNTGLIVGNKNDKVNGIIICLDATKEVVQEAIDSNKNLIISFIVTIKMKFFSISTINRLYQ